MVVVLDMDQEVIASVLIVGTEKPTGLPLSVTIRHAQDVEHQ